MLLKVITVISLLKVCTGDVPEHHQPQSNHAISSQSFVRHDVPLSYKFSSVHIYTSPKPDQYRHKPVVPAQFVIREPPQIQYAPIHNGQNQYQSIPSPSHINLAPERNLEPKPSDDLPSIIGQPEHLSYVPGYNVEVLQSVNRYPGHNAVYRSYPNMSPSDKLNKINFLNQYVLYQKQNEEFITSTQAPKQHEVTITAPTPARPKQTIAFVKKEYNKQKPHPFHGGNPLSVQALPRLNVQAIPVSQAIMSVEEYLPHPKAHRMLLNIARTYNIARGQLKAQHAGLTFNNPTHTQAFIQIKNPLEADKSTLLSVQNKNLYSPVHKNP
ncbi:uncharacterized protein LOC114359428 [Ostrinia furnacalis]|uniref:uncharacterized protein LOC114359428 n=1 Tax=Ostrinia furnacalis TaxID=93504 RepID=UPI00103BF3F8|nr:uncharacterized protein LOC114359428 [Ostrinia furnacalis]